MHFVFDFGRVLFNWQPEALLRQTLPARVVDEASAAHWVAQVFQSYGGDWGEFDRGTVEPTDLVQRISQRTGLAPSEVQAVVDAVPAALTPISSPTTRRRRCSMSRTRAFTSTTCGSAACPRAKVSSRPVSGSPIPAISLMTSIAASEPTVEETAAKTGNSRFQLGGGSGYRQLKQGV